MQYTLDVEATGTFYRLTCNHFFKNKVYKAFHLMALSVSPFEIVIQTNSFVQVISLCLWIFHVCSYKAMTSKKPLKSSQRSKFHTTFLVTSTFGLAQLLLDSFLIVTNSFCYELCYACVMCISVTSVHWFQYKEVSIFTFHNCSYSNFVLF